MHIWKSKSVPLTRSDLGTPLFFPLLTGARCLPLVFISDGSLTMHINRFFSSCPVARGPANLQRGGHTHEAGGRQVLGLNRTGKGAQIKVRELRRQPQGESTLTLAVSLQLPSADVADVLTVQLIHPLRSQPMFSQVHSGSIHRRAGELLGELPR